MESVVCLSTDKAVYPINAMGISKAMMEKVAQAHARNPWRGGQSLSITRYGNVMYSRGSVIPVFVQQIKTRQASYGHGSSYDSVPYVARGVGRSSWNMPSTEGRAR